LVRFADDHEMTDYLAEIVRNVQKLSIVATRYINAVVLCCTNTWRAALEMMEAMLPAWN